MQVPQSARDDVLDRAVAHRSDSQFSCAICDFLDFFLEFKLEPLKLARRFKYHNWPLLCQLLRSQFRNLLDALQERLWCFSELQQFMTDGLTMFWLECTSYLRASNVLKESDASSFSRETLQSLESDFEMLSDGVLVFKQKLLVHLVLELGFIISPSIFCSAPRVAVFRVYLACPRRRRSETRRTLDVCLRRFYAIAVAPPLPRFLLAWRAQAPIAATPVDDVHTPFRVFAR